MNLSFKEFTKLMIFVILPIALYFFAYATLIVIIPYVIFRWIALGVTIIPVMYFSLKITTRLVDYIDRK